jgi:hypothetical protein
LEASALAALAEEPGEVGNGVVPETTG